MTPAARVQAAIELLDQIIIAARDGGAAADVLIARYFKERRYAGSKDRRAVRELVYRAIRRTGERPVSGRAAMLGLADTDAELAALFTGEGHGPAPIDKNEPRAATSAVPAWLVPHLYPQIDETEQAAMLARAPLDLRVNTLKTDRAAMRAVFPDAVAVDGLEDALRLPADSAIQQSAAYRDGLIEVQDAGSQWLAKACGARAGMRVIDLCAGGGGKTLALAADMGNDGQILATDIARARLQQLAPRAERAGATIIDTLLLNPGKEEAMLASYAGEADLVLIDAPCSGSGTWRRNPESRWRLTPERLAKLQRDQANLLDIASKLVAPEGKLVYAVCAITGEEGADQVDAFVRRHSGWTVDKAIADDAYWPGRLVRAGKGAGRLLTPHHDGTDGFYFARLQRG